MSGTFESFGRSVILNHPLTYIHRFGELNSWFYLLPPLADMEVYNSGQSTLDPLISHWFGYPNNHIFCLTPSIQKYLSIYAIIFFLLNIYFWTQLIIASVKPGLPTIWKADHFFYTLATLYLLGNFLFSVFAAINVLRYQYIPMYVLITASLLVSENLVRPLVSEKIHLPPFAKGL